MTRGRRGCWPPTRSTGARCSPSGRCCGLHEGDNPHRWYDPADVERVAARDRRRRCRAPRPRATPATSRSGCARSTPPGLAAYHALIASIRRRYAGVPVGASESIFALQAPALGLRLLTPPSFMKRGQRGHRGDRRRTPPPPSARSPPTRSGCGSTTRRTSPRRSSGSTASPARTASRSPPSPRRSARPSDSFEQWQVAPAQRARRRALHRATGR